MTSRSQAPYWLTAGTETCPACTHGYAYEMVLRCVGCDRGVCTHCAIVVRETRETWCPDCHAATREG